MGHLKLINDCTTICNTNTTFCKKVQLFLLLRYSFNYHNFQYRSFHYGFRMVKSIKEKIFKLLIKIPQTSVHNAQKFL